MNPSNFENKIAIITGGANGIGKCITETFIDAGITVAIIDMDKESGAALEDRFGDQLFFFHGDIAEQSVLDSFISEVLKRFPQIDFLVNNAMISKGGIIDGCSFDDFTYTLQVGVSAPYYLAMKLKDFFTMNASIINISSTRSTQSQANTESYSAAKGGIAALTHALSVSLAGITRVNAIAPGWIDTSKMPPHLYTKADRHQHSVGRVGKPEDIAKLALFLCGEDAGFINGQEIFVDGGMTKLMIYHDDHGWTYQPN